LITLESINKSIKKNLLIEALLGSAAFCIIAFLLFSKYGFGWADEGLLWYASQRTYAGELAIRDFFAYDPGRYYWNSLFFLILGNTELSSLLIAAAAFGWVGLAVSWYTMGAAKISFGWRLFFAILIVIALCYPRHKVYEQSLSLVLVSIVYFVLNSPLSIKRWFLFGLLTGIAAVFGRNHGVFFVVSAILTTLYVLVGRRFENIPRLGVGYLGGVLFGYSPIILSFIFDSMFRQAFLNSVLSTLDWQLPLPVPFFWKVDYSSGLNFDTFQALAIGLVCVLVPAVYFAGALLLFKGVISRSAKSSALLLLGASAIAGIPYLHQALDRADFGHIAQSILPVFIACAALLSNYSNSGRKRILSFGFCFVSLIVLLSAWLPSLPASRALRMESEHPGSLVNYRIGNEDYLINSSQSSVLAEVRRIAKKCQISDKEFLALPHFPGIYAYLGLKAPFWEMYYLYPRSPEFQLRHIEAMASVRLILVSPDATIDGLEGLKLRNTYGQLMDYIDRRYKKLNSTALPNGIYLYADTTSCDF
jgi:hypothetical protein